MTTYLPLKAVKQSLRQVRDEAFARGKAEGQRETRQALEWAVQLNGHGPRVVKALKGEDDGVGVRSGERHDIGAAVDQQPDQLSEALTLAACDALIEAKTHHPETEGGPVFDYLRGLLDDPEELQEAMTEIEIVKKSLWPNYAIFDALHRKAFDESKHPRGDDGRFIGREQIHAAKSDPELAQKLRDKTTDPTERAKLDAALEGKSDLGRTKAGLHREQVSQRRQDRKERVAKAQELANEISMARRGGEPVPSSHFRELAEVLPAMTVAELRSVRGKLAASFGGDRRRDDMVLRLLEHAKNKAALLETAEKYGDTDPLDFGSLNEYVSEGNAHGPGENPNPPEQHGGRMQQRHEIMAAGAKGDLVAPNKLSHGTPDTGSELKLAPRGGEVQGTPQGTKQPSEDALPATAAHNTRPTYTTDPKPAASVMSEAASSWLGNRDLASVGYDEISRAARAGELPRKAELELKRAKLAAEESAGEDAPAPRGGLQMEKPPPGGWKESDKVGARVQKQHGYDITPRHDETDPNNNPIPLDKVMPDGRTLGEIQEARREGFRQQYGADSLDPLKTPRDKYAGANWQYTLIDQMHRPDILGGKDRDTEVAYHKEQHRQAVAAALAAGKPVPPEVLADYPDLAATLKQPSQESPNNAPGVAAAPVPSAADDVLDSIRNANKPKPAKEVAAAFKGHVDNGRKDVALKVMNDFRSRASVGELKEFADSLGIGSQGTRNQIGERLVAYAVHGRDDALKEGEVQQRRAEREKQEAKPVSQAAPQVQPSATPSPSKPASPATNARPASELSTEEATAELESLRNKYRGPGMHVLSAPKPGSPEFNRDDDRQTELQERLGKMAWQRRRDAIQNVSGMPPEKHRKYVEQALAAGKPVPAEVLADYPDLASPAPSIPTDHAAALAKSRTNLRRTKIGGAPEVGRHVVYRDTRSGKVSAVPADSYMGKEVAKGAFPHFKVEGEYEFNSAGKPVKVEPAITKSFASDWSALRAELQVVDDAPPG